MRIKKAFQRRDKCRDKYMTRDPDEKRGVKYTAARLLLTIGKVFIRGISIASAAAARATLLFHRHAFATLSKRTGETIGLLSFDLRRTLFVDGKAIRVSLRTQRTIAGETERGGL